MSITRMVYKILAENRALSGDEMHPHWAYRNFQLLGDSIVSFCGPFNVPPERWIDIDSIMHGLNLPEVNMLHIIIEHFNSDLPEAMLRQYVLVSILEEKLLHRIKNSEHKMVRLGDDLFEGEHQLSVTAVGTTLVSSKIHLGVFLEANKKNRIHGLKSYGVDPLELSEVVINQYRADMRRLIEKSWRMKPIT